ncbi:MAG: hypothetical protein ACM3PY_11570 [Omnitrophica WOR_2 bacterium]
MKKKYALTLLIVILAMLLVVAPVLAAPSQPFYLEKVCDMPNSCLLQNAAPPFDVLNGGRIYYFDHTYLANPAGNAKESAAILLTSADGQHSLLGSVSWVLHDGDFRGRYIIQNGTGALEGVHANGVVNVIDWDTSTFSLEGVYFIAP